ncbi:MAG: DUF2070 family protein [Candidatus Lokiarchaeota archaeon]|nr:DUF2070 family protein [Candidatus Lokiarchaeota archaeon]
MAEKAKVKETVNLYSKIWQLPSYRGIVLLFLTSALVLSLGLGTLKILRTSVVPYYEIYALYLACFAIPIFIGTAVLYLLVRKEGSPLDFRRTLGAVLFGIFAWVGFGLAGGIIDFIMGTVFFESRLLIIGLGVAYALFSFLITGMSDYHPVRNVIAALFLPLLWFGIVAGLGTITEVVPILPQNWLLLVIIIIGAYTVAVNYIYKAVSRPFERDLGLNGPDLLRAFGYDYLADNPEPFEKLITKIAKEEDIPVEVIVFKSGEKLIGIGVALYVHPGPFRNIGSSSIPSYVQQHIEEKYNVPAFIMHGTCTHHQNLTTKDDFERIVREIDRLVEETPTFKTIAGPHYSNQDKFKVWSIFVGNDVLNITTSAPEFTDDIALQVGRDTADMIRSRVSDIDGVVMVDAHNCIGDEAESIMPGDPEASEYVGTVSSAVFAESQSPRSEFSMGISTVEVEGVGQKQGIGPGGITAIALKTDEKMMALVSIDGNNMEPGYRDKIVQSLKKNGYTHAEVITTDTHVVNAISLSSKGYPPVGRYEPVKIKETILIAAEQAQKNLRPASMGLGFGEVQELRTFGEKGFDTLTKDIVEASRIAKKVGLGVTGFVFLLSFVLSFLL